MNSLINKTIIVFDNHLRQFVKEIHLKFDLQQCIDEKIDVREIFIMQNEIRKYIIKNQNKLTKINSGLIGNSHKSHPDMYALFVTLAVDFLDNCYSFGEAFEQFKIQKWILTNKPFISLEIEENLGLKSQFNKICEFDDKSKTIFRCCCSQTIKDPYLYVNKLNNFCVIFGSECITKTGIVTKKQLLKQKREAKKMKEGAIIKYNTITKFKRFVHRVADYNNVLYRKRILHDYYGQMNAFGIYT